METSTCKQFSLVQWYCVGKSNQTAVVACVQYVKPGCIYNRIEFDTSLMRIQTRSVFICNRERLTRFFKNQPGNSDIGHLIAWFLFRLAAFGWKQSNQKSKKSRKKGQLGWPINLTNIETEQKSCNTKRTFQNTEKRNSDAFNKAPVETTEVHRDVERIVSTDDLKGLINPTGMVQEDSKNRS